MAAIFLLSNFYLNPGIDKVYVTVDFISMGLLELQKAQSENYKMKNCCPQRDANSLPLDCNYSKSTTSAVRPSNSIYTIDK